MYRYLFFVAFSLSPFALCILLLRASLYSPTPTLVLLLMTFYGPPRYTLIRYGTYVRYDLRLMNLRPVIPLCPAVCAREMPSTQMAARRNGTFLSHTLPCERVA